MLKRFEVENFKNFNKKIVLDFSNIKDYQFNEQCIKNKLINKMIIYGKNASGKTNLGYAIFDITCHLVDNQVNESAYRSYINGDSKGLPAKFKYVFQFGSDEVTYYYEKEDFNKLIFEELYINNNKIFSYNFKNSEKDFSGLDKIGANTLNLMFLENQISLLRYIANNTAMSTDSLISKTVNFVSNMLFFRQLERTSYMGFSKVKESYFEYIIENNYVEEFEKFLNENGVNEKLTVSVSPLGEKILCFAHDVPVPLYYGASSGTLSMGLFFYWYKHFSKVSFLYIDEFDAFYHFELAENIVKKLEQNTDFQVILTSHNTDLLSNRIMRPDCYFIISNENITSFADATQRELREGHNLEKLYKSGEFNG